MTTRVLREIGTNSPFLFFIVLVIKGSGWIEHELPSAGKPENVPVCFNTDWVELLLGRKESLSLTLSPALLTANLKNVAHYLT